MSERAADDVVSRCRRIERVLGIDLDSVFRTTNTIQFAKDLERSAPKFRFAGDERIGLAMMKSAARRYAAFVNRT